MSREGKARVLSETEFKRVLKVAGADRHATRNVALLLVSFGLGLRVKEIGALSVADVLDGEGQLRTEVNLQRRMTKGNKQRHAYLSNRRVRQALQAYLEERRRDPKRVFAPGSALFLSNKGSRFTPLYKQAGIEGASSHSGRRTFATRLIEKGVDIKAVSRPMGHATVAMTAEYVEDNPDRLRTIAGDVL